MLVVNDRDQVELRLDAKVLRQVDLKNQSFFQGLEIDCRIEHRDLSRLLETALGISPIAQGVIVIRTYCDEISLDKPIVRTLLSLDGDLSQKIHQVCLKHQHIDRIFAIHTYAVRQISQQLVKAIAKYLDSKLFPIKLFLFSLIGTLTLCDPINAGVNYLTKHVLPNPLLQWFVNFPWRCLALAIALSLIALCTWLVFSKLSDRRRSRQKSNRSQSLVTNLIKLAINKIFVPIGTILDQKVTQRLSWLAIAILLICWLVNWQIVPISPNVLSVTKAIEANLEPTFSLALYSVRQTVWQFLTQFLLSNKFLNTIFKFLIKRFT
ncbi:MAG: hypothetical protein NW214_01795 [Pseudanabaenaceae cyanobacterium bins.39]|nr:hypothetical protein [Pseudanabaenaceae cyanobacterium bins.39]